MKQKSYRHAKVNCKICLVFMDRSDILDELDYDCIQGMSHSDFLQKYNKVLTEMGSKVRLVSSNYFSHRGHIEEERAMMLRELKEMRDENEDDLNKECIRLRREYMMDNVFLNITFNQRLKGLNDMQKILVRRKNRAKKLRFVLRETEKELGKAVVGSGEYNSLVSRELRIGRELESLENSMSSYIKGIDELSTKIENTYRKRSEKFSGVNVEEEVRERLNSYFFQLNDNINDFMSRFRVYLELDEFRGDFARSENVLNRAAKMLIDSVTKSIHSSAKLLPSSNISEVPGVHAVEETLEYFKGSDSVKSDQQSQ
jgi:hypothetical protein